MTDVVWPKNPDGSNMAIEDMSQKQAKLVLEDAMVETELQTGRPIPAALRFSIEKNFWPTLR